MQLQTSSPSPSAPIPCNAKADQPTLLFVDDEERILRSLRMMFVQNFNVRTTTSGHEALDILRREPVHVLISDQRMPIMTGVELLRQAREVSPNTMRLLLTGYSDLEAVAGSINEGEVFRYINKPWNPTNIRTTINNAVEIALKLEAPAKPIDTVGNKDVIERILVIDDDPDTAIQIKSLLDEHVPNQHVVEWASDVDTVFNILEHSEIALVISEVRLAGEDVTSIIKALKQHQPNIITLAHTSFQDSSTLVGLINEAQIHRFLLKPVRRNLTWRGIESCLQRHRALKAAPELVIRHQVETPPVTVETPIAKRILGFFRNLGKRLN